MAGGVLKSGILIGEDDVECQPDKIPSAIIDENVDIYQVRKYFSQDAWCLLEHVVSQKAKNMTWMCTVCYHDLHSPGAEPSVICDACLRWYHFSCVGLLKQPKAKQWFCRPCRAAAKNY